MKVTVDLTREKYNDTDTVHFYDSKTIFFDATTFLPSTVSFKIWGAGLMPGFEWTKYIDLDEELNIKNIRQRTPSNETIINGFGTLTLKNVVAGKISISPYDNKHFLKDSSGNEVVYKREWTLEDIDSDCYEYWLDTTIYFPYGGCDLKLYARGEVTFEFDTDDCVSYIEYITNPNRRETFWGYLKDGSTGFSVERHLNLHEKRGLR